MSCQVRVTQGILEGKISTAYNGEQYYSFEGIPYAKPPVGDLRFKAPLEPESWTGVRDATKPGNKCAQINAFGKRVVEGSEDCLYLNIYTPSLPADKIEKLPVLFFIHGGRLILGYGDYYKPDYLLRHKVIMVTINYRLNILGFLCLETPEVPGNAGLKDTVMALKWVNDNIKYFNGDETNITVQGESAGAGIAASYITSKMADGLYNKIICQSGTSISDLYIIDDNDPIDNAKKIASYLGHDVADKTKLYDLFLRTPIEDLVFAYISAEMNRPPSVLYAFLLPVIENEFDNVPRFFDEHPIVPIRENRHQKVPLLIALNSDEGAAFIKKDHQGNIMFAKTLQDFIPNFSSLEHNTQQARTFAKILRDFYFNNREVNDSAKLEYLNLISDHYFNRDVMLFTELMSKFNDNVYCCRFGYSGNLNTRIMRNLGVKGATHGDLTQYLFYRENRANIASEQDLVVVDTLTEAWCNFAKTGKPHWKSNQLQWPPYTTEKKSCLNIDNTGTKIEPFRTFERIKFWFNLIQDRAKL